MLLEETAGPGRVACTGRRSPRLPHALEGAKLQLVSDSLDTGPAVLLSGEEVAAISRALADPRRFAILQQIAGQCMMPCSALNVHGCISPATISHHIKELQNAGLIRAEREGRGTKLTLRREVWQAYLRELGSLL